MANGVGYAEPGQIGFQQSVTPIASDIQWLHNVLLMPIITMISLFVLALLAYVVWRFNEKANPTPSKTTHNTLIEVAWTIIPVLILVIIAIPSFRLLTDELVIPQGRRDRQGHGVAMALGLRISQGSGRRLLL